MKSKEKSGFAIIEILVAITILSIVLLSIITGVSGGIIAISGNNKLSRAMIIAKSKLNEFRLDTRPGRSGPDLDHEPIEEYPGFYYSRIVERFEHELLGPVPAKRVEIIVIWNDRGKEKSYTLTYIFPTGRLR